jgi:hypothetical protein
MFTCGTCGASTPETCTCGKGELLPPEIVRAMAITERLLARMRKTCSGESVAFDKLHVLEVIADELRQG